MPEKPESERTFKIIQIKNGLAQPHDDKLAVEEPMEVRIVFGPSDKRSDRSLAITMRTPDHDFELAVGFLFTEGIISSEKQIEKIEFCGQIAPGRLKPNIVRVELTADVEIKMQNLQRHFYTTSSCGICGKGSLDALEVLTLQPVTSQLKVTPELIHSLPDRLRASQPVFSRTGGIHAAGIFDRQGNLNCVREDVGRHNAVDKLIGRQLLDGKIPLGDSIIVVSGRASFELLQKSLGGGLPILVAVGAPSSLAVDLAHRFNMTLIGFTNSERFNIYSVPERIL